MAFIFNPNKKRGVFMIPSGATKSPTPTPPSFNNTYSLAFDGVDDTVNFQNDWFAPSTPSQTTGNTVGSVSFWVKLPTNISSGGFANLPLPK